MDHHDELFIPETVEEQIEWHMQHPADPSTNGQMIQALRHLEQENRQRVAEVRTRLASYVVEHGETRRPILLQAYQRAPIALVAKTPRRRPALAFGQRLGTILGGLVAVLLLVSTLLLFVQARPSQESRQQQTPTLRATPALSGKSALLLASDTGQILIDVNSRMRVSAGTFTPYMVATVAIENADLQQMVLVDQASLDRLPQGASTAHLQAYDQLSLHDLLYGLLLPSGNDAAAIIARAVAGNPQALVTMMNNQAHQLRLDQTHFSSIYTSNTPNHYINAADLARLMRYALQLNAFSTIISVQSYTLSATNEHHSYNWVKTTIRITNVPNVTMLAAGHTQGSGYYAIFTAKCNGRLCLGVELNAPSVDALHDDINKLLQAAHA